VYAYRTAIRAIQSQTLWWRIVQHLVNEAFAQLWGRSQAVHCFSELKTFHTQIRRSYVNPSE